MNEAQIIITALILLGCAFMFDKELDDDSK